MSVEAPPWLIENMWMAGRINALFGPEKAGKSRLLGWLLAAIYADQPSVLGMPIRSAPAKALYLAGEEPIGVIVSRIKQYVNLFGKDSNSVLPIYFIEAAGMRLDTQLHRAALEQLLVRDGFDTLIIEPLRRVHGGDEDSNTQMAGLHNDLRRWTNGLGVTVILVHHTGKLNEFADTSRIATWSRGCTDLAAILDTAAFLEQVGMRHDGRRLLRLNRAGRFPPTKQLTIIDSGDPTDGGSGFWIGD